MGRKLITYALVDDDSVYDYTALLNAISEKYSTVKKFCVMAGISTRSWSDKVHDVTPWTSSEITRIIAALDLTTDDIPRLFFTKRD